LQNIREGPQLLAVRRDGVSGDIAEKEAISNVLGGRHQLKPSERLVGDCVQRVFLQAKAEFEHKLW